MIELNSRQQRFVELYTSGMAAGRAYEEAGYQARGNTADVMGSKLLRNAKVAAAIAEVQADLRVATRVTKVGMIERLMTIIESRPDEAAMDNPLCEVKQTSFGPVPVFTDKANCMEKVIKMLGFYAPEVVETSGVESLAAAIAALAPRSVLPDERM